MLYERFKQFARMYPLELSSVLLVSLSSLGFFWTLFIPEGSSYEDTLLAACSGTLGGGVFAYLMKLTQISGVVRQELEKVVFSTEYMSLRRDQDKLWLSATKSMYGDRFPQLQDKLTFKSLQRVWPSAQRFYFENMIRITKITVVDKDAGLIEIASSFTATLVTDTGTEKITRESFFDFPHNSIPDAEINNNKINGIAQYRREGDPDAKTISGKFDGVSDKGQGSSRATFTAKLKPDRRYDVWQDRTLKQNLNVDNVTSFTALSYVNGLQVTLDFDPEELTIQFKALGGATFSDLNDKPGFMVKKTDDLLFADAGYLVTIQLK